MSAEQINDLPLTEEDFNCFVWELAQSVRECLLSISMSNQRRDFKMNNLRSFPVFVTVYKDINYWSISVCRNNPGDYCDLFAQELSTTPEAAYEKVISVLQEAFYVETP